MSLTITQIYDLEYLGYEANTPFRHIVENILGCAVNNPLWRRLRSACNSQLCEYAPLLIVFAIGISICLKRLDRRIALHNFPGVS
jgi:hypothetical protein